MSVIGQIEALFRYPVKSMRGESLGSALLGWHGIEGDRRLALRRIEARGDFPWLSASKLPELILFTPQPRADRAAQLPPTHVRTPDGAELPVLGDALAAEVGRRLGEPVHMMQLKHGVFDEASISVISSATIGRICALAGTSADVRRFRPNILVRPTNPIAFDEDRWIGGSLRFGDEADAPRLAVTQRDQRCAMVCFDPDDAASSPAVMRAAVEANDNHAGVYCAVTRTGRLIVGQNLYFDPPGSGENP